jgi:outer membrane protein assembly factor BamB
MTPEACFSRVRPFALALAALCLTTAASRGDSGSATMFRADAAHVGVFDSNAPTLHAVQWRFHANGPLISSPAVADGVVYVGSNDGNLYALRASDGVRLWHYSTSGPVTSSPAVANGVVYFASEDGGVYAVDTQTGVLRWRFATEGEHRFEAPGIHGIKPAHEMMADPFDLFISSPAIANQTVYIGSGDHNVYALDAATGALRWKFTTGNVVHATPAVADGMLYIGSWDRNFYALDAATGNVRWKFTTGDDQRIYNQVGIQSSAAVANGMVYFGCRDSHLYALDARDGTLRWKHDEFGSWVVASPAIYNGAVYFTTSDEHVFFALDAQSGAVKFHDGYATFAYSSPSIAGGVAYYGSFDGMLYAVDAATGNFRANFQTDGARKHRAAHLDAKGNLNLDTFYPNGTLAGINTGIQRLYTLGSIVGAPAIAGGMLYAAAADGTLYALN